MKFEKFAKKVVPHGQELTLNGQKWLASNKIFAKIPAWAGSIGVPSNAKPINETLDNIYHAEIGNNYAELKKAYLPFPDSKAKDIMRVFSDGKNEVHITNEQFALIEKSDSCVIALDDEGKACALLIGAMVQDIDDFEPDAIILDGREE